MKIRRPSNLGSYVLVALLGMAVGMFLCYRGIMWLYSDYVMLTQEDAIQVMTALQHCLAAKGAKPPGFL